MSSLASKQGPRYRHIADEAEPYETIGVEKLTPIIGAEISGVDLGKLVTDDSRSNRQMDEIHRALAENLVIFFRDQHITPPQQVAFTRRFGEIEFNIFGERWSVPGSPEIVVVSNVTEDGRPIGVRRAGENWHSDMCCASRRRAGRCFMH